MVDRFFWELGWIQRGSNFYQGDLSLWIKIWTFKGYWIFSCVIPFSNSFVLTQLQSSGVAVLNFEYISRLVLTFNFDFIFCNTHSTKKGVFCRSGVTMVSEFPKREEKFEISGWGMQKEGGF